MSTVFPAVLGQALSNAAERYPAVIAVICDARRRTYAELEDRANRLANVLVSFGCGVGSKVGLQIPRSPEYLIAYFGATKAGATIVPLGPDLTAAEMRSTLQYCDVELLLTAAIDRLPLLFAEPGALRVVFLFGAPPGSARPASAAGPSLVDIEILMNSSPPEPPSVRPDPDSPALLLHTSGSLSAPKRVMLSHRGLLCNARAHAQSLNLSHEDVALLTLPLWFGYCNTAQMLAHCLLGGTMLLLHGQFTPARFFTLVERGRATTSTVVPSMLSAMAESAAIDEHDTSSMRCLCYGGSSTPKECLSKLRRRLPHVRFVQTYGLTEASPRVTTLFPDDTPRRPGSVGKPIPGVEVRIAGHDERTVAPFEIGEIAVRGPGVMLGYYKRPEATAAVLRNGWLFTGDLGYQDDRGYLYLLGRKKSVIIRGGVNVYPEEIEERLLAHPAITDAVVAGERHAFQGEVPVARVVRRLGSDVTEVELAAFCAEALSPHKLPIRFEFVQAIEKTYNQKRRRTTEIMCESC